LAGVVLVAGCVAGEARDVTFLSTSDSHYRQEDHPQGSHNALNVASIEAMNGITQLTWPEKLGGGAIATPRGVLALGDLIDNGDSAVGGRQLSAEQYAFFEKDFGLTGKDGLLRYPVYDGWGNHDGPPVGKEKNGFSMQAKLLARNKQRGELKLATHFSPNGLHYSWDWDDVHFVQLNLYPADRQDAGIKYNPVWHDPQLALSFLKQDLADQVGLVVQGRLEARLRCRQRLQCHPLHLRTHRHRVEGVGAGWGSEEVGLHQRRPDG
jgi:cytolysin (calcineurin-like family phosphatase)